MNNPSPRFTGLFIPAEIWAIEDLTLLEINLLAWIDALYSQEYGGCFASNEYLAYKMRGVKENTIAKAISKLRDMGLVEDVSFDGRRRVIRACIGKAVEKRQSKSALDLNPSLGLTEIQPCIGQKSNKGTLSPYIENKEEKKDKSELPFGRVASYFYEKLAEINPKVKKPNLDKWAKELHLLAKDGNTEQDIIKTIDYVIGTHNKPSSNGFSWANVVLSPQALRKNFPKIWGEMQGKKKTQDGPQENQKLATAIAKKFKDRDDIRIGHDYLEFINGPTCNHIKFEDKDFKLKCTNELAKRKIRLQQ